MSRGKLTDEERMAAVQEYLKGEGSYTAIAEKYNISAVRLQDLVYAVKEKGIELIKSQEKNRKYASELKEQAVREHLSGKSNQYVICAKYGIKSRSILQKWISCYNSGNDFKECTRSKRGITMNKGRKTTQEERCGDRSVLHLVRQGLWACNGEIRRILSADIFMVRKYEVKGVEGLTDRRGKAKPENALTEAGRLRMENKILQAKLKDMEMENKLLKKLRELQGGGH